jgi:hypothetical protein
VIELDQELVTRLECPNCHTVEEVLRPLSEVTFDAGHCPTCGILREAFMTHLITGEEPFLHRTLASVGVPPLHIIRANNGVEYRFYELTGDLPEALHFHDYESTIKIENKKQARIRIDDKIQVKVAKDASVLKLRSGRVRLRD